MNLKEIAYSHYLPAKRKRRRANTVEGYESALRCHVVPRFGCMELHEITHEAIQEWVDGFELPGAARKAFKTLRQVIRWAIPNLDIRIYDPTQGIELPARKPYRPQALEPSEVKATLRGFFGSEMEPTVLLSTCLGLRPGECYALEWRDIDMRTGAVSVNKTLVEAHGLPHLYPPKTAKSNRVVYLPRFARDRLRTIWRERNRPKGRIIGALSPHQAARLIRAPLQAKRPALRADVRTPPYLGHAGCRRRRCAGDSGADAWPYRHVHGLRALPGAETRDIRGCPARLRCCPRPVIPCPGRSRSSARKPGP